MAAWLDTTFQTFDYNLLAWYHSLAESYSGILTPFAKFISFCGGPINLLAIIAIIMFIFNKNRKMAIYIVCSIGGALVVGNFMIKIIVDRARPFESLDIYRQWWEYAGSVLETDASFPSGHTNAAMAGITAIFMLSKNKKVSWLLYLYVIAIGFSRNYLIVHYPTDVIAGVITGLICAFIAKFILDLFFKYFGDKIPLDF